MYVCMSFDCACRLLGYVTCCIMFYDKGYIVGCPVWVCMGNLVYYLAVQPIDGVAYKLSDLAKLTI